LGNYPAAANIIMRQFFYLEQFFLLLAGLSSLPKEKNSFEGNKEPPKKY